MVSRSVIVASWSIPTTQPTQHNMKKYKLNVRDVDQDEDVFILNLPRGYRFDDEVVHVRGFDSMKELMLASQRDVEPCDCKDCKWDAEPQKIMAKLFAI
jgi:hypothetical protein